jgi:hypothetical protein
MISSPPSIDPLAKFDVTIISFVGICSFARMSSQSKLSSPSRKNKMRFSIIAVASAVSVASAFTAPKSFMGKTSVSQMANSNGSNLDMKYKVAVVGGGPSGACAAEIFAQEKGIDTVMFERKLDNAKPCGGAIPLCMVGEFDIPESVVDRKVRVISALIVDQREVAWTLLSRNDSGLPIWTFNVPSLSHSIRLWSSCRWKELLMQRILEFRIYCISIGNLFSRRRTHPMDTYLSFPVIPP